MNFRTQAAYANVKPLVVRIDDVGRAEAVQSTAYRPQAPELRCFLTQIVVKHFSRIRATIQREYPDSLYFLDPALAVATIAQNDHIEAFLTTPSADEVDIVVQNVSLSELLKTPYKATIAFQKMLSGGEVILCEIAQFLLAVSACHIELVQRGGAGEQRIDACSTMSRAAKCSARAPA